jgi:Cu/Ag efflux pump CusA
VYLIFVSLIYDLILEDCVKTKKAILMLAVLVVLAVVPVLSFAQDTAAPSFTPGQLDKLVARIALYPDWQ